MVNVPGSKQVPLRPKLVELLRQRWMQDSQSKEETHDKFGGYVNDLLERILAKYDFVARYAPECTYVGFNENVMLLKDSKLNAIVEVMLKNGRLYCSHDRSQHCNHIFYALAIPEVVKMDLEGSIMRERIGADNIKEYEYKPPPKTHKRLSVR